MLFSLSQKVVFRGRALCKNFVLPKTIENFEQICILQPYSLHTSQKKQTSATLLHVVGWMCLSLFTYVRIEMVLRPVHFLFFCLSLFSLSHSLSLLSYSLSLFFLSLTLSFLSHSPFFSHSLSHHLCSSSFVVFSSSPFSPNHPPITFLWWRWWWRERDRRHWKKRRERGKKPRRPKKGTDVRWWASGESTTTPLACRQQQQPLLL